MKQKLFFASLLLIVVITLIVTRKPAAKPDELFKNVPEAGNETFDKTMVFIGDSMTEYLGNFDELKQYLQEHYQDRKLLLLNYGFGSTNILSVTDRLDKDTEYAGRIFQPVNNIDFDLVFLESFGHNPLSEFPLAEGLKKQEEALDKITDSILLQHPNAKIVFIATIAPNKYRFGEGVLQLNPEQKEQWAKERMEYIKNHIRYAKSKNIPLINIYEKSLNSDMTGNVDYLNSNDFIHPSPTGVYFISKQIADFIYQNKLL